MARPIPIFGVRWVAACAIAIEAEHGECRRDGAKKADECRHHPFPARDSIQNMAEQLRALDGKLTIDCRTAWRIAGTSDMGLPFGTHMQRDGRLIVLRHSK